MVLQGIVLSCLLLTKSTSFAHVSTDESGFKILYFPEHTERPPPFKASLKFPIYSPNQINPKNWVSLSNEHPSSLLNVKFKYKLNRLKSGRFIVAGFFGFTSIAFLSSKENILSLLIQFLTTHNFSSFNFGL